MSLAQILKRAEKFVTDNSPAILTAVGVTGTIATALLVHRATLQASEIIKEPDLTRKDKIKLTWVLYVPPVAVGTLTCTAIIFANQIGTRRAAAVASAYALTEQAFSEYKDKVVEKIGQSKETAIRDEIAQDKVDANPVSKEVVIVGEGDVLCFESFSARYFMSSMENIKRAQNDINYQIINDSYASLADFYSMLGLKPTAESHEMGWNTDKKLDLNFSATMSEDSRPCIVIEYRIAPIRDYWRFR